MKKILITGFEPFGGDAINPALEAIKKLGNIQLEGGEIITCSVPVVMKKSIDTVIEAIQTHHPDIVITVGQAGGRYGITPERVAINMDDYRIKDNEGNQVIDEPVVPNAPIAYFSTLPIKAIVKNLHQKGIPATISNTAGTFVCNHLFFGVQHYIETNQLPIKHGFIHIPLLLEQATQTDQPTMALETIVKGLKVAAQTILDYKDDIKEEGGTIC